MPRGGGGSSRSKGSGGGNLPREVQISKAMSWLLRHGAKGEGIKMDENGYVNVADLLAWRKIHARSLTFPELQSIIASDEKHRFAMIPASQSSTPISPSDTATSTASTTSDPSDPSQYLIRANQGHSLAISSENLLKPILLTDPDFPTLVVHGTNDEAWKGIRKSGCLKRMSRRHVHFARGVPGVLESSSNTSGSKEKGKMSKDDVVVGDQGDEEVVGVAENSVSGQEPKVISGMRTNATVMIWVDVARSIKDGGLKWWRSENGVVLTEGDGKGTVSMEWFDRVEARGTGKVLWRRGEGGS